MHIKRIVAAVLCAAAFTSGSAAADTHKQVEKRQERHYLKKILVFDGWAIPRYIVMCESGGKFKAVNPSSGAGGAYQIMPATWRAYGGRGLPQNARPYVQHKIAHRIWVDVHAAAWSCR